MKKVFLFSLFLILLFGIAHSIRAANAYLYLSPNSGTYRVGDNFLVQIRLDSGGISINSADGRLTFDASKLQVVSISKDGSIFNLWVQEPTFSNSAGTIDFAGGKPSPGFIGNAGKVATITFKGKSPGKTNINFNSGSILADDGAGTNVLTGMRPGSYELSGEAIIPITPSVPQAEEGTPDAPIIYSPTHPDQEKWYSNNIPKFDWEILSDITGEKLLVDRQPSASPTIFYSELITGKELEKLDDGIWYFHTQLLNSFGWGAVSHFRFQIDTQAPDRFEIKIKQENETNPQPILSFETKDEISGIDYYEIIIDQQESIITKNTEYKLPPQNPGKYKIIVKAIDKAGNYTLAMTEINISSIEMPAITDYPFTLFAGSPLTIKGTALPEVTVKVYFQKLGEAEFKTEEIKSSNQGNWSWTKNEPIKTGDYQAWVEAIDSQGAKSELSEKVDISITPAPFLTIGKLNFNIYITIICLLILIIIIISITFIILFKKKKKKEKIKKQFSETEKVLYRAFKTLKEEIEEQVAKLDGKEGLSQKEKEICKELKITLKMCEKFIQKELKELEKTLK